MSGYPAAITNRQKTDFPGHRWRCSMKLEIVGFLIEVAKLLYDIIYSYRQKRK